jgi:hypothetical protein
MVIEGIAPATLFLGAKIVLIENGSILHGPFALLSMNADQLHVVPFHFRDVVLGRLTSVPEGAKLTELLPAMITDLLSAVGT